MPRPEGRRYQSQGEVERWVPGRKDRGLGASAPGGGPGDAGSWKGEGANGGSRSFY